MYFYGCNIMMQYYSLLFRWQRKGWEGQRLQFQLQSLWHPDPGFAPGHVFAIGCFDLIAGYVLFLRLHADALRQLYGCDRHRRFGISFTSYVSIYYAVSKLFPIAEKYRFYIVFNLWNSQFYSVQFIN